MLSVEKLYVECRYAKCHYAERRGAIIKAPMAHYSRDCCVQGTLTEGKGSVHLTSSLR
jgi:hypothetical protein